MFQNHRILAIIPARSGSKELVDKNIKELNNKPLLAYTIEACKNAEIFDDILVSTDSVTYGEIATRYGASVPFLRPDYLAEDHVDTAQVVLSVIQQLELTGKLYDSIVLLQPTSPLRNEIHIKESLTQFYESGADTLISICKQEYSSYLNVKVKQVSKKYEGIKNNKILSVPNYLRRGRIRRQDHKQNYRINGAIYIAKTSYFKKYKSFFRGNIYPYLMDEIYSIDIDNEFQFRLASFLLHELYR